MPTRRSPRERANLALLTGRVAVLHAHGTYLTARVTTGAGATHTVEHQPGEWSCTCEQTRRDCAHIQAVMTIARPEIRE